MEGIGMEMEEFFNKVGIVKKNRFHLMQVSLSQFSGRQMSDRTNGKR